MRSTAPFAVSAAPAEAGQDLNTVSAYTVKHIQKGPFCPTFLDYLRSMDGREDTYSLGRHSCRTFSQAMMEEAKRRKNSGGCKNDKKCE